MADPTRCYKTERGLYFGSSSVKVTSLLANYSLDLCMNYLYYGVNVTLYLFSDIYLPERDMDSYEAEAGLGVRTGHVSPDISSVGSTR